MIQLLRQELFKAFRSKWIYVECGLIILYYCCYGIFPYYVSHNYVVNYPEVYLLQFRADYLVFLVIAAICIIFIDEFEKNTIYTPLFQAYSRVQVLTSKILILLFTILLLFAVSMIASYMIATVVMIFSKTRFDIWNGAFYDIKVLKRVLFSHLMVFVGVLPSCFIGIVIGIIINNKSVFVLAFVALFTLDNTFRFNKVGLYAIDFFRQCSFSWYARSAFITKYDRTMIDYLENRHIVFYLTDINEFYIGAVICVLYCVILYAVSIVIIKEIDISKR